MLEARAEQGVDAVSQSHGSGQAGTSAVHRLFYSSARSHLELANRALRLPRSLTFSTIRAIAAYTLLEAVRNRLLWLVAAFIAGAFVLAEFIGDVAIAESVAVQSAFLGATLRACSVLMLSLFVITSLVREFNDKVLELVLSQPIPRASYYFGKLAGFSVVAMVTAVLCGLCLLIYVPPAAVAMWSISLALELLIVIALSLVCLLTFSQVTLALSAVLGFYLLSRTIGAFQLMADNPLLETQALSQQVIDAFIDGLAFVLPALDRFTATDWLLYHEGEWAELGSIAAQTLIYLALLAGAGLFDLYRKNL